MLIASSRINHLLLSLNNERIFFFYTCVGTCSLGLTQQYYKCQSCLIGYIIFVFAKNNKISCRVVLISSLSTFRYINSSQAKKSLKNTNGDSYWTHSCFGPRSQFRRFGSYIPGSTQLNEWGMHVPYRMIFWAN